MKLQKKTAPGFRKYITVGYMVVTEFILRDISVTFKNCVCSGEVRRVSQIQVKISKLTVFRNRIAVSQTQTLQKITVDVVLS